MEELEQNHRSLAVATIVLAVALGALITFMMILFPLTAYDNPNAGLIPGLVNSPQGNILTIAFMGLVAAIIGTYLNTATRLERERNAILARSAEAAARKQAVEGRKQAGALPVAGQDKRSSDPA